MRHPYSLCLPALLLFILSCNPQADRHKRSGAKNSNEFEKGSIVYNVQCNKNPSLNYTLFLPSYYSPEKKWPVIIFFDSHARGKLPVLKYKDIGKKYGYILAGSNNMKNNLPEGSMNIIANVLISDIQEKFSVNPGCINIAGFSGGARTACAIASQRGGINTVIACAAGPPGNQPLTNKFNLFGTAGDEDFNYQEMLNLDLNLDNTDIRHYILSYDGKHEWPPDTVMYEAFCWMQMNEIRDGNIKNDKAIRDFINEQQNKIKKAEISNDQIKIYVIYEKIIHFLDGIYDVSDYKLKLEEVSASDKVKSYFKNKGAILKREIKLQRFFANSFHAQSFERLQNEIKILNDKITENKNKEESLMFKRVINYISMLSFIYSDNATKAENHALAEQYLKIYRTVDPDNPDINYLNACLECRSGNPEKALEQLKEAFNKGFDDHQKLQQETAFEPIRNNREFRDIINGLKEID